MRVAINLLTEHPDAPSGAHWFWTRIIPEMAARCGAAEELHLIVSPRSRALYEFDSPNVRYITFPWSNERRSLRTLSEHLYSPVRLPYNHIDVLNTLMPPVMNPTWSLVIHMKTMHAFTATRFRFATHARVPALRIPALGAARRRHHHQLRERSLRDHALPRRRRAEVPADLRSRRSRALPARRRRCRTRLCQGQARNRPSLRPLRLLTVAVQEL